MFVLSLLKVWCLWYKTAIVNNNNNTYDESLSFRRQQHNKQKISKSQLSVKLYVRAQQTIHTNTHALQFGLK
jgi:hypothetical protein